MVTQSIISEFCKIIHKTTEHRTKFLRWNVLAIQRIMYKHTCQPLRSTTKEKITSFKIVFILNQINNWYRSFSSPSMHTGSLCMPINFPTLYSDCTSPYSLVSKSNSYSVGVNLYTRTLFAIFWRQFIRETLFCTLLSHTEPLNTLLLKSSDRVRCVSIWCVISVSLGQPL